MAFSPRLLLPALAVLLASCAPSTGVLQDPEHVAPTTLASMLRDADDQLHALRGTGSISFESPEAGGSLFFDLSLRKPDSLLVVLEGPFGMDMGTLFLSRRRFVMVNAMENTVTSGDPGGKALRAVLPLDLTADQIISAFTGSFPLPEQEPTVRTMDDGLVHEEFDVQGERRSYWIEPEHLLVRRFVVSGADGATLLEGTTAGVLVQDGVRLPRRIILTLPGEGRQVTVGFTSVEVNPAGLSFDFTVPSNARIRTR